MRYIVGLMMFTFLYIGIALVIGAMKTLFLRVKRLREFERADGIVTAVKQRSSWSSGTQGSRGRTVWTNFPVIAFAKPSGETVTFTSEIGDANERSKYQVGQRIRVRYHPAGLAPPMIDSWAGIWYRPFTVALGGTAFIAGAFVIYFAFGEKIFGEWAYFKRG